MTNVPYLMMMVYNSARVILVSPVGSIYMGGGDSKADFYLFIALFTVSFYYLLYNVIQHECKTAK